MKNFNFAILMLAIILTLTIQAQEKPDQKQQQSLLAYWYTNLIPEQSTAIPAAKDAHKKVIIFDLNGVLCTTNKLRAAQIIGIDVISAYILEQLKLPGSADLFATLQHTPAISTGPVFNKGIPLPQIMVDWKAGMQESRDIQDAMIAHIAASNLTTSEKNLYTQTVIMMTTPAKLIITKQIIIEGLQLARHLKKLGYKIYILSNWDPASFPLFIKNFPDFFTYEGKDLFDGIMISGQQHTLKPDLKLYQACLKKFNIDPHQAVFIDDTIENIHTAQQLGISSIHCKNNNIHDVQKQLKNILCNNT